MPPITQISPRDAYARLQDGAILLDVRESDEITQLSCDVPHVLNVPMSEFQTRVQAIPKYKEIITICYSGSRSFFATQLLVGYGYSQVSNLAGGIVAWKGEGFPVI